jgi:hypothetical protein
MLCWRQKRRVAAGFLLLRQQKSDPSGKVSEIATAFQQPAKARRTQKTTAHQAFSPLNPKNRPAP